MANRVRRKNAACAENMADLLLRQLNVRKHERFACRSNNSFIANSLAPYGATAKYGYITPSDIYPTE